MLPPSQLWAITPTGDHPLKHQAKMLCMCQPHQPGRIYLGEPRRQIEESLYSLLLHPEVFQTAVPHSALSSCPQSAPSLWFVLYLGHALHLCLQSRDLHVPPSPRNIINKSGATFSSWSVMEAGMWNCFKDTQHWQGTVSCLSPVQDLHRWDFWKSNWALPHMLIWKIPSTQSPQLPKL